MDNKTKAFYDEFWPKNVPRYEDTKSYMLATIRERNIKHALDAGCGHGVCSVILSQISEHVTSVDISNACIETAKSMQSRFNRSNIDFVVQDLQELKLADNAYDLIWCWGVAMMAPDPMKVFHNLFRTAKPGGVIYLGLYLKTWASPIHQLIRHFCRRFMNTPTRKKWVLDFFAFLTRLIIRIRGSEINLRADNVSIQAQVDDWYYPPYKTFFSIKQIREIMERYGFKPELIQDRVGRMKSATIFVMKGTKITNSEDLR